MEQCHDRLISHILPLLAAASLVGCDTLAPPEAPTALHIHGCGETWAGSRLTCTVAHYPLDAVFSDTVWVSVRGC